MKRLLFFTIVWLAPVHASASPPELEARLRSDEVEVGEPTELAVTITGASDASVHVPQVAMLDIAPVGTSQRVEIVNGSMRESITHHYRVVARRAGRFTIAPITALGVSAGPLSLAVRPASAPRPAAARTQTDEPASRRAMLRVRVPKRRLVVGESVPITIRVYVKAGTMATIEGVPELGSDAFAIHSLVDEAQRGETEIDGTPYATLTWRGRLTPLLPGDPHLAASVPATLRWRELVRREAPPDPMRDRFASMFDRFLQDDPFFARSPFAGRRSSVDALFGARLGPERQASVVLRHDLGVVHVTEPPPDGRPADFGGAVGRFTMRAEAAPDRVRAGEPFTVRLAIEGEGTFERVAHELFRDGPRYRVYPVTARFDDRGADGRRGAKTFEQTLVPVEPGVLELGSIAFSYFDPSAARYVTLTSDPLRVEVEPAAGGARVAHDLDDAARSRPRALTHVSPGRFVERLWPIPRSPYWMLACAAVMVLAIGAAVALARRDPEAARIRRARGRALRGLASARRRMRASARRGDAAAFFAAARAYAQRWLSMLVDVRPEAITLVEAEARLAHVPAALRDVLERADAIAFAGERAGAEDLRAYCRGLERALAEELPIR